MNALSIKLGIGNRRRKIQVVCIAFIIERCSLRIILLVRSALFSSRSFSIKYIVESGISAFSRSINSEDTGERKINVQIGSNCSTRIYYAQVELIDEPAKVRHRFPRKRVRHCSPASRSYSQQCITFDSKRKTVRGYLSYAISFINKQAKKKKNPLSPFLPRARSIEQYTSRMCICQLPYISPPPTLIRRRQRTLPAFLNERRNSFFH